MKELLESAWQWRERSGELTRLRCLRVFHGPGEGAETPLADLAIDRFQNHFWITQWNTEFNGSSQKDHPMDQILVDFLKSKSAESIVRLIRPEKDLPAFPNVLWGLPPSGGLVTEEQSGSDSNQLLPRYWIQFQNTRHPGLFLDHEPLRRWLLAHSRDRRVLNTFAYTGSLSVAAAVGGAAHVTTLDQSKTTIEWAKKNWELNGLATDRASFIADDFFERTPRWIKKEEGFDLVVLDPPSFARAKRGTFSTSKDLIRLHELGFKLLSEGGTLVTSINSAQISHKKFETDVSRAAQKLGLNYKIIQKIQLPKSFRVRAQVAEDSYLKGLIVQLQR